MAIPVIGAIIKAAAEIKNIPVEIRQNHTDPIRAQRRELRKLQIKIKERGYTIVPELLFVNPQGYAKLTIALAKGKHHYDKRETIKAKDSKRDMERELA